MKAGSTKAALNKEYHFLLFALVYLENFSVDKLDFSCSDNED